MRRLTGRRDILPPGVYKHRMHQPDKRRNDWIESGNIGMPPRPSGSKPGVSQLLIASALDADLCRRLLESPEETFQDFDLTEDERDLLRRPDQRMLRLFGVALAQQRELSYSDKSSDVR